MPLYSVYSKRFEKYHKVGGDGFHFVMALLEIMKYKQKEQSIEDGADLILISNTDSLLLLDKYF